MIYLKRGSNVKRKRKNASLMIILISSIMVFFFGVYLVKSGFKNFFVESIKYSEDSSVDYRVYLKKNSFFEEPYLGKGKVYITSLIDYLDIYLKYSIVFDEAQTGNYKYGIKGVISADLQSGNDNYWQKEYILSEEKEVEFDNINVINVDERLSINYDKYNDLLMDFKKQFGLSINGYLRVYLYIITDVYSDYTEVPLNKESIVSLSIPLTKATIEVPIQINAPHDTAVLATHLVYSHDSKYLVYKIVGFILMGIATILIIACGLVFVKTKEMQYYYEKELKRILKTYDSIIVNVKKMPSISGLKIIEVSEFSELLDAHSEVRAPINFCNYKDKAEFVLFNHSMAWRYVITKEEIYEKKK